MDFGNAAHCVVIALMVVVYSSSVRSNNAMQDFDSPAENVAGQLQQHEYVKRRSAESSIPLAFPTTKVKITSLTRDRDFDVHILRMKWSYPISSGEHLRGPLDFVIQYTDDPCKERDKWHLMHGSKQDATVGLRLHEHLVVDKTYTICIRPRIADRIGPLYDCVTHPLQRFSGANDCVDHERKCFHYGKAGCSKKHVYNGTRSYTKDGIKCQEWSSNKPKPHKYNYLPKDYCRNPSGDQAPWCYATKKIMDRDWDYCLTDCSGHDCYDSSRRCFHYGKANCKKGLYNGSQSYTVHGTKCQEWSSDISHYKLKHLPKNYCRNPDDADGPWCYTVKENKKWDYCFADCRADECFDEKRRCFHYGKSGCSNKYMYNGTRGYTRDGVKCHEWSSNQPKKHEYNYLPEDYCRNPSGDQAPWCYATKPVMGRDWDYCLADCSVDKCFNIQHLCYYRGPQECREPHLYNGTTDFNLDRNIDKEMCTKWSLVGYNYLPENYCRNPDSAWAPWCYTKKVNGTWKWNYCFPDCWGVIRPPEAESQCKIECWKGIQMFMMHRDMSDAVVYCVVWKTFKSRILKCPHGQKLWEELKRDYPETAKKAECQIPCYLCDQT